MSRRKWSALLALLVIASVILSACGAKPAANNGSGSTTNAGPKKPAVGGELNLRLAKDPDNFNPILSSTAYGSAVYGQVYATLFEFNEKFEPTPYIADKWSASADGLVWTINLKQGIKFTNGDPLNADDVVFTLGAIMDKDYQGPRSLDAVKSITKKDDNTVIVTLKEPFAPILSDINYGILDHKLFANTSIKEMDKNPTTMSPVGAGPYKFVEYKRSQYVLLERNPDWFMSKDRNGAPFIKTLRFKVIPDDTTAVASLENGEIDLDTPLPNEISRLEKDDKDKLVPLNYERNGFGYMQFNVTSPILSDKLVRQALTYGLDRQSIIAGVMDGRAVIPAGPIPPVSWAYDSSIKPYAYDKAKAGQLLDQAGWKMGANGVREKDGKPFKITFYGSSGSSLIDGIAQIAKKNWKDIGVDLDVQLMDFNAMMDNFVKPGKFDVSFSGMSLSLDPDQYDLWHSTQVKGFNRGRWANPQADKLLVDGRKETDQAKRKAIYSDFQKVFQDDCPAILVYANKYTDMVSTKVKGGVVNFPGAGASFIYRWWINEQ
ncbi:MAG: ABC transporter substrate-binding protein [Mycobacterium leprae]